MNLIQYIEDVKIKEDDNNGQTLSYADKFYILGKDDLQYLKTSRERCCPMSDYAVANGGTREPYITIDSQLFSSPYYLRTKYNSGFSYEVVQGGELSHSVSTNKNLGIMPCFNIKFDDFIKICDELNYNKEDHTIQFGEMPQNYCLNSAELENAYKNHQLQPTGKYYMGSMDNNGVVTQNKEYDYKGKKFVRVLLKNKLIVSDDITIDGSKEEKWVWFEVKPVKWVIYNFEEFSKHLEQKAQGEDIVKLRSQFSLLSGIPFSLPSPHKNYKDSIIRQYLNTTIRYGEKETLGGASFYHDCFVEEYNSYLELE